MKEELSMQLTPLSDSTEASKLDQQELPRDSVQVKLKQMFTNGRFGLDVQ